MNETQYNNLFRALQEMVDQKGLSVELGKALVKEINRFARKEDVSAKFNPDDLELTPDKFAANVAADSEADIWTDDSEESSDY